MKLIDEKGRLLGIINVIDFVVILFLLAAVPTLYFGYRIVFQKQTSHKSFGEDIKEVQLNCKFIKLKPEIASIISGTDVEVDDNLRVIGEIAELGAIEPDREIPTLKQCPVRLKLKAQFRGYDIYYNGKLIDYNSEIVFKTNKYSAIARVSDNITKMLTVGVTLKDLDEDTINLIAIGDKELDDAGRIVAEIVKIGKPENNSFELDLGGNNFALGRDIKRKQIATEIVLKCQILNGDGLNRMYFGGKRITYNSLLEVATDKYKVNGLVSKAYELVPEGAVKWIRLKVKFSPVILQVADSVKKGDVEKDSFGEPIARVINIVSNEPTELVSIKEGKITSLVVASQRDVVLILDMFCSVRGDNYYFKDYSIKMGNYIVFSTALYSITGTIIGIEFQ